MKKRMLIAFALIAILATTAFAADFGWGGAFRSVWAVDMGTDQNFSGIQFGVLAANGKLDDNNSVAVVLEYADNGTPYNYNTATGMNDAADGGATIRVETAVLSTDIFGALGFDLPVTLKMNNGIGRLNLHDRFNGVGTGFDPEIIKSVGALNVNDWTDGGQWNRYTYTGFDIGIMDMVNVRVYTNPGSWDASGADLLAEVWAPIAIADIMTLDIGAFMTMSNGYLPVDTSVTGHIVAGLRVKGNMSFGMVGLGFWLGATMSNDSTVKDGKSAASETTTFTEVLALNANIAINDAMSFKVGAWGLMRSNSYTGTALTSYNAMSAVNQLADIYMQTAFDFSFNYAAFTVFGGFITGDMLTLTSPVGQGFNGRWEAGIGYGFGATSMRLGVTGYLNDSDDNVPTNDGLSVCGPASTSFSANSSGNFTGEIYFMAGVWF